MVFPGSHSFRKNKCSHSVIDSELRVTWSLSFLLSLDCAVIYKEFNVDVLVAIQVICGKSKKKGRQD